MQNSFWKSSLSDLDPSNYLVLIVFTGSWDKIQIQFWDPYPPNHLVLQRICMNLGQNPGSILGPLSSKPAGLQQIRMILGLNPDSVLGS